MHIGFPNVKWAPEKVSKVALCRWGCHMVMLLSIIPVLVTSATWISSKWFWLDVTAVVVAAVTVLRYLQSRRRAHDFAAELQEVRAELEQQNIILEFQNEELQGRETALREARDIAESAARAKSEFLANMSHEIRTPMTAILGYAELLRTDGENLSRTERQEALHAICRNGEHLLTIINDILDFSKIEAGKMTVEKIPVSLNVIVDDVVAMMKERASAKGITLTAKLPATVPTSVMSDPARLRQILINLVGNAIKFTETGGVHIDISFEPTSSSHGQLAIAVHDTGIGIAPDRLEQLFDAFVQSDSSTTRRFGGTGLGLSISQRLAELLGGHIDVTSEVGTGSTFTLHLPVEVAENTPANSECGATPAAKSSASGDGANPSPLENRRILLAEDGIDNQRLISLLLKKAGADVEVVENGQEAVEAATKALGGDQPFDVILMDMQMPVLDGYGATRQHRDQGYSLPILALTANAMEGERDKCLEAGCDDYATKPIQREKFIALVAEWAAKQVQPTECHSGSAGASPSQPLDSSALEPSPCGIGMSVSHNRAP